MKKAYINPETVILNVEIANLCSVSSTSADMYSTKTGASGALSRDGGGWDDED